MKAITLKFLAGMVITLMVYTALAWIINHTSWGGKRMACWINPQFQRKGGQEYRIAEDWSKFSKTDIVVFGSSHAYRGYDPREFEKAGYSLFTAGSGFQNTLASYTLYRNEFIPTEGSLVIIDLFDQTFEGDGVGCYTRLIENVKKDETAWELTWRRPDLRTINSYVCRLFSKNAAQETPDEEGYLFAGYCPKQDTMKVLPKEITKENIVFNLEFVDYLDRFVGEVTSSGKKMVIVCHPQPRLKSYQAYHDKFRNCIDPVLQKHKVLILDYNNDHQLENLIHFADANHLNQAGVSLFNHQLIADLQSHGLLSRE